MQGREVCTDVPQVWALCTNLSCVIDWLDHWQTLIAGGGAIAAAAVSVFYLRKQIGETARIEDVRRARRLAAARSRLQLALSDVTHYANDAIALLKRYLDAVVQGGANLADLSNLYVVRTFGTDGVRI